jgi:hypothetical protein
MLLNLDRYKRTLIPWLPNAIQAECFPEEFESVLKEKYGNKAQEAQKALPRL